MIAFQMTLAIDIGNTHIVLGLMEGVVVRSSWRVATDLHKTADEYFTIFQGLMSAAGVQLNGVSKIVAASVVPPLDSMLEELAARHIKLPIQMATSKNIPIIVKIPNPGEVGSDRLVNAYAAREFYGKPAIVVDLGTATTLDAVSREGEYLGGAIAPGIGMGRDALYEKTAKLPKIDLSPPAHAIGRGTEEAIRSGLLLGYSGLLQKLIGEFRKELASEAKVVGTGGFISVFPQQLSMFDVVDEDLTLKGLALLAR